MIKGIIFALEGTLLDCEGDAVALAKAGAEGMAEWYLKKKRVKLDQAGLAAAFLAEREAALAQAKRTQREGPLQQVLRAALQQVEAGPRAEAFAVNALRIFFAPYEAACRPSAEAIPVLKTLHAQGLRLAILANAPDDALVQRLVNRAGLRPWVGPVFSSAGVGLRKPHPAPFRLIATRWRLSPQNVLVVGSALAADILGAKNAGMPGVLLNREAPLDTDQSPHLKPRQRIDQLGQLPLLLETLHQPPPALTAAPAPAKPASA